MTPAPTFLDFYRALPSLGLSRKAVLEVEKLPRRLRLDEVEDLVAYPATLAVFERQMAAAGAALFAGARDPGRARAEANSRIRSALKAWLARLTPVPPAPADDWRRLEAWVKSQEGDVRTPGRFGRGQSVAIAALRARLRSAPATLGAAEVAETLGEARAETRKSLRRALRFLNNLIGERDTLPAEVADLLPAAALALPVPRRRLCWPDLPTALRASATAMFDRILVAPELLLEDALARIAAGEDAEQVAAQVNASPLGHDSANPDLWRRRQEGFVSWLYRGAQSIGAAPDSIAALLTLAHLRAAIDLHQRNGQAGSVRPAHATQTLHARVSDAITLAGRGLQRPDLVAAFRLLGRSQAVRNRHVRRHAEDSERLIGDLHRSPELIARIVRAPELIAATARERLASWPELSPAQRLAALKLGASAALWALQLSRPRRRRNLQLERIRAARDSETGCTLHARTLREDGKSYISRTEGAEVKNGVPLEFVVAGRDAEILRRWIEELRPLYLAERGIPDSCYLLPGTSRPRNLRTGLSLPAGTISDATFANIWNAGADVVGLRMTTHQARHAVATAWLSLHPGDYAGVGAILGNTADTARRKYGQDDSAVVAHEARRALQKTYGKGVRHGR